MSIVDDIYRQVREVFVWKPDLEVFHRPEHWDRPVKRGEYLVGDCDDFAIECYHRLRDAGVERARLALAVCRTVPASARYDHCVLLVQGDGLVCLDNRQRHVTDPAMLGYDLWQRQQFGRSIADPWVSFSFD